MDLFKFNLQRFATTVVTTQTELQNALNSAAAGDTIQLGADIDVTSQINVSNTATSKVTLDLNGKTITATGNGWVGGSSDLFKITQGNIEVKNGKIDVNIDQGVLKDGVFESTTYGSGITADDYLNVFYVGSDTSNALTLGENLVMDYTSNTTVYTT